MATGSIQEVVPPVLPSNSDPPPLFDGTTRLYLAYPCPFAQRAWITRNYKGLQNKIQLVPINLLDKPAWYKNVHPHNTVPAIEHDNKVVGESLAVIKYIDSNFEGPSLLPDDPAKKEFAEHLFSYSHSFIKTFFSSFKGDLNVAGAAFDHIETALSRFDDGPFFLGQFSLVDIAYISFMERFQPSLLDIRKYDITAGRSKLAAWIEEMNKIEAYNQTRREEHIEGFKKYLA